MNPVIARRSRSSRTRLSVGLMVCLCVVGIALVWIHARISSVRKNDARVIELISQLGDPDWTTRYSAADSLGETKDARAAVALVGLLNDEHESVRWKAELALKQIGMPAVDPLVKCLMNSDSDARALAAAALGGIGSPRAAKQLIGALRDTDPQVRSNAAAALGEIQDPSATDPLIRSLTDTDPVVRLCSTKALGRIKDPRAAKPLCNILSDTSPNVRREAIRALSEIGAPAVEPLIVVLRDNSSGARGGAIDALEQIVDPRVVEPLISSMGEKGAAWWYAADAISRVGPPAVGPLLLAMKDKNAGIRSGAVDALGQINDPRTLEALIGALHDPDANVRNQAGRWLPNNDPRAVGALMEALRGHDIAVIAGAYLFFIRRGEPGSEEQLVEAINKYGDNSMALKFVGSGNKELESAGESWAYSNGYRVTKGPGDSGIPRVVWGEAR